MKEIVWRVSKIVDQCIKAFDVMNNPARIKLFHYGLLSHQQHVNYNLEHIYVYKFGLILCEEDYYSRSEEFLNEYKYPNDIFGPRNNWFVPYGK
ncbi:hypothetical protein D3C81_1240080 [compost metagenome]